MLALTIVLYTVSAAAGIAGVVIIVVEARTAQRALQAWNAANPQGNDEGSWAQGLVLNRIMSGLLGRPHVRYAAACLVALGLVTGAAANFTALWS